MIKRLLLIVGVGVVLGLLFMSKSYVLLILSTIMIFGIAALGLNLLSGYAGQLSIGHGSFMAVGAYTTAMLSATLHSPFYVNIFAAVILSAILGLIIGLPALRLKGFYLAIATMAFGVAVEQLFAAGDLFGGHGGIFGIPKMIQNRFGNYLLVLFFFSGAYAFADRVVSSPIGIKYNMVRDSEIAATSYGISLRDVKLNAFVISAIYGGVAGVLYAHTIGFIQPSDFGLATSINLLAMIIIGGMASLEGGLLGSAVIIGLPFIFSRSNIPMSLIIGILLIVFVLFFPKGLVYGFRIVMLTYMQRPYMSFRRLRAARRSYGDHADVKGKKIFYVEEGTGTPVLYIHGNLGSHKWYSEVMSIEGARVIALDLPNFGFSDRIDSFEIDVYADYVKGFIEAMGLDTPWVLGHSLGGAVAISLAIRYQECVRGLVLVDSASIKGLKTPEESYPVIELYKVNYSLLKKALCAIMPGVNDRGRQSELVDCALLMSKEAYVGHGRALTSFDYSDRTMRLDIPVLFIYGEQDILITREMAEETVAVLGGSVHILEGIGHSPQVENPTVFRTIIKDFIQTDDSETE